MKTKFNALLLLSVLFVCGQVGATLVPKERINAYRKAVGEALGKNPLECIITEGEGIGTTFTLPQNLDYYSHLDISSNGSQPLLTFLDGPDLTSNSSLSFRTSPDYLKIVGASWKNVVIKEAMVGDFRDPHFEKMPVVVSSGTCNLKIR